MATNTIVERTIDLVAPFVILFVIVIKFLLQVVDSLMDSGLCRFVAGDGFREAKLDCSMCSMISFHVRFP